MLIATTSSFISVQCYSGAFVGFSTVDIPATVSDVVLSVYTVFAPLYQLNFQASDLPATHASTTSGATPASTTPSSRSSGQTTTLPSPTAAAPAPSSSGGGSGGSPSSPSGLSSTARIGIGVGVAVGAVLLFIIAFLLWRLRRRDRSPKSEEAGAGRPVSEDSKKKPKAHMETELGGTEVKELDGHEIHAELPTQQPSHRMHPDGGPMFRRSDQNWVISPTDGTLTAVDDLISPVEPHHGAVFELEGESTRSSMG